MRCRRPQARSSDRVTAGTRCAAVAAVLVVVTAGCSSHGSPAPRTAGASTPTTACGTTRTAANVPVSIQVARGQVSCATALEVERDYARAILAGKAPGNGGGGPVNVLGWTCEGFATPVVLKTGQASKCVQGGNEILAILPAPA
jgi:hypothetical protein